MIQLELLTFDYGIIHVLTFCYFFQTFQILDEGLVEGLSFNWTTENEYDKFKLTNSKENFKGSNNKENFNGLNNQENFMRKNSKEESSC